MRTSPILLCLPFLASPLSPARADSHAVTIVNSSPETIRRIEIGNAENRLRSSLPPGAQAPITYSTGCQADVRLAYDGGRTETFPAVDVCSNPRIVTGQGVTGQGVVAQGATGAGAPPTPANANPGVTHASTQPAPIPGGKAATKPGARPINAPAVAPPPVVPPWTGKSLTKRFGGME